MSWGWSRKNEKDLARFVTPEAVRWLKLPVNRTDLLQQPDGRRQLVQAIYEALAAKQIRYAPEQYHPSEAIQLIRTPPEILEAPREGTCLDLAALFCGLCLGNDLLPLLVVIEGHALAAVSLNHGQREWNAWDRKERAWFETELLTNPARLRELVDSGAYLLLECTGFARSRSLPDSVPEGTGRTEESLMPFEQAIAAGCRQLERTDRPFRFAIDIAVAHYGWRIEPHTLAGQYLVKGITALPTNYSTRIQNFLTEYLGTLEQPVPFGGREADLERLDNWLEDLHQPPYLLLAAPAGRGKSALLVRWSRQLLRRDDVEVIFFPVSIRFRTNLASVVFAAIAARLAALHGDPVPGTPDTSVEIWRGIMADYLNRPLPEGRRLLVILDGVDEAADWEPGPDLFPFSLPSSIRVVLSARYLAGDTDASAWLRRLGWDRRGLAHSLDLDLLSRQGVADVLTRMGFPLDQLGKRVAIVAELYRLSEGDPLLVRLYVDDLWARGEEAARLQPEDLQKIEPGLEGYFAKWWEDQEKLWGDDYPLEKPIVEELFNVLSCAFGPLKQDDVLRLASSQVRLTTWTLDGALRPLKRFIIGDRRDQGYAFSHPRLGSYFYDKLSQGEQRELESRFLNWGKETLKALNEKQIAPKDVSPYIIQYYSAHLIRAGCDVQEFVDLLSEGWQQAWFWSESSYAGFLNEVKKVWQIAERANAESTTTGKAAAYLGAEIRCALCQSSIFNLSGNIGPELLLALVEKGVWKPVQGLAYAQQIPNVSQRVKALDRLAEQLQEPQRSDVLAEALAAAQAIRDEEQRARALVILVPHLPEPQRREVLAEALAAAQAIEVERLRVEALGELVPHLPEPQRQQFPVILAGLTQKTAFLSYLRKRVSMLFSRLLDSRFRGNDRMRNSCLENLPQRREVLAEALAAAQAIGDKGQRARALVTLLPYLPELQRSEVLAGALMAARSVENEYHQRAFALQALVPHLPEPQRSDVLAEVLAAAKATQQSLYLAKVLCKLMPHLPEPQRSDVLAEALIAARTVRDNNSRAEVLVGLVPHLPEPQRSDVLAEALATAQVIGDEEWRAAVLRELAPRLPEPQRSKVLVEMLAAALATQNEVYRAAVLDELVLHLPEPQQSEAVTKLLAAANSTSGKVYWAIMQHKWAIMLPMMLPYPPLESSVSEGEPLRWLSEGLFSHWVGVLHELVPHLLLNLQRSGVTTVDEKWRVAVLGELAPHLPEPQQSEAVAKLMAVAQSIQDNVYLTAVLDEMGQHLPESLLGEAFAETILTRDESYRAQALGEQALHLSEPQRSDVLAEALTITRAIRFKRARAVVLHELAPHLAKLPPIQLYSLWRETLLILANRTRKDLLSDIRALDSVIYKLGGEKAIVETFYAIRDVGCWWP